MKSLKFINFSLNLTVYKYHTFIVTKLFLYLKKKSKIKALDTQEVGTLNRGRLQPPPLPRQQWR